MRNTKNTLIAIVCVGVSLVTVVGMVGWALFNYQQNSEHKGSREILPVVQQEAPVQKEINQEIEKQEIVPANPHSNSRRVDKELPDFSVPGGSEIVTGHIWASTEKGMNFQSVTLPMWGIFSDKDFMSREYTIDTWNGTEFVFYKKAHPLEETVFPKGVSKFRVTGIDPEYAICPDQKSLYTWIVKFYEGGVFNGERTTIVEDFADQGKTCRMRR